MAINREPYVAADYAPGCHQLVRRTCLEVATRLGDFRQQMCVVGGLVPSLLIDQPGRETGLEAHIGTIDLDLGLSIVVLNERLYEEMAKRLREAGLAPDINRTGNLTTQRWRSRQGVTVDFLIPPSTEIKEGVFVIWRRILPRSSHPAWIWPFRTYR